MSLPSVFNLAAKAALEDYNKRAQIKLVETQFSWDRNREVWTLEFEDGSRLDINERGVINRSSKNS